MPTTRARPSASAPPELPGFSAASVWITLSTTRPSPVGRSGRARETTPAVTDRSKPFGLPTATTSWPTRSARRVAELGRDERVGLGAEHREVRQRIGADDLGAVLGAVHERGADRAARAATTWAEVTMKPSCEMTTPLPLPVPLRRCAIDGRAARSTEMTTRE